MRHHHFLIASRALSLVSLVFIACSQVLFTLNRQTIVPQSWGHAGGTLESLSSWLSFSALSFILPAAAGLLGLLVISQHPHHPIGRMLALLGMAASLSACAQEWAIYGYYTTPGGLPGAIFAAWFTNWSWMIMVSILLWMLAIFPEGRLMPGFLGASFIATYWAFFLPTFAGSNLEARYSSAFQIPSPLIKVTPQMLYDTLFAIGMPAMALSALALAGTVWARWRRSTPVMRQQIKWLIVGVGFMAGMISVGLALSVGAGLTLGEQLVNNATLAPLLAIGVAISRYRMYDVDVIIRRTLVYSLVTVLLAGVYLGGVTLLQVVFNSITRQRSTLTVVISTLVIAALFNPLRSRIQTVIDRRFYRLRYDADQALAGFAHAARSEVEIDSLANELLRIVTATVRPENASLWLKPGAGHSRSRSSPGNIQTGE